MRGCLRLLVIGYVVLALTAQSSVALLRLKDISAEGLQARKVVRVAGSIGIIDHELLKQDFRFLQQWDNKRIEEWFLDTVSVFREQHLDQAVAEDIHDPVRILPGKSRRAYTSSLTKRSLYVPVEDPQFPGKATGFIDVKGSGTDSPKKKDAHANGVMVDIETFLEAFFGRIVRGIASVVTLSESFKFVGIYGVVIGDADFHGYSWLDNGDLFKQCQLSKLALVARQAFPRSKLPSLYLAPPMKQHFLEHLLNAFGLIGASSAFDEVYSWDMKNSRRYWFMDYQTTKDGHWIDYNLLYFPGVAERDQKSLEGKPVHMIGRLISSDGCISPDMAFGGAYDASSHLRTREECISFLESVTPLFHYPTRCTMFPEYDLHILPLITQIDGIPIHWSKLWGYDFSVLFPEHEQQTIRELISLPSSVALHSRPTIMQEIYDHLSTKLKAWPQAQESLLNACRTRTRLFPPTHTHDPRSSPSNDLLL